MRPAGTAVRVLAAGTLAAGLLLAAPAQAGPVPNDATWTETYITTPDGTKLHADVLLPKRRTSTTRHPVILSIGPYFGSGSQQQLSYNPLGQGPSLRFKDLIEEGKIFKKGYAFVMVDSRGYGSSSGCNDYGGPGEQSDAKAAVEWAATQPFSTGKVAMWGKSYDAWTQVMALAGRPRGLSAVVIQSPLIEAYRGIFENGVHYGADWFVAPTGYAVYDLTPQTVNDGPEELVNALTGTLTNPDCYAANVSQTTLPDRDLAYWQARDIVAKAGESRVPTLWSHGFNDVNTKPTNIFPVYSALRGPKRAWFGQWNHVRGNEAEDVGRKGFMGEAMAWLDHWLKGVPLPPAPAVEIQDGDGAWRGERSWPPADAVLRAMALLPGSWVDERGNSASVPQGGTWSASQPAPHDVRMAGLMRLEAEVVTQNPAGGNLVALVYDVAPDGSSRLITRGASFVTTGTDDFGVDLWPQDWLLPKGHRLAVQLSADDSLVYQPTYLGGAVTIESGRLLLPILRRGRTSDLVGNGAAAADANPTPALTTELEGRDTHADFGPRPTK